MQYTIIFDLDGTLVDSSAGILASLKYAYHHNHVELLKDSLSPRIVGPPLREIVHLLTPHIGLLAVDSIIETFKSHYDETGYHETVPYNGVDQMLNQLLELNIRLAIVTNKRKLPTDLILHKLGWSNKFFCIYCPDSSSPHSLSKSALIGQLLKDFELDSNLCTYIGDRIEDWHSSRDNSMRFGWAQWGYSPQHPDFDDDSFVMSVPDVKSILPLTDFSSLP